MFSCALGVYGPFGRVFTVNVVTDGAVRRGRRDNNKI